MYKIIIDPEIDAFILKLASFLKDNDNTSFLKVFTNEYRNLLDLLEVNPRIFHYYNNSERFRIFYIKNNYRFYYEIIEELQIVNIVSLEHTNQKSFLE
ncbi:MAG: type II toxin-antitoxin system RelE/ParE family toxin [Coprobacillaceae bacterium]